MSPQKLAGILEVVRTQPESSLTEDLFPPSTGPVVRLNEQEDRELVAKEWGFFRRLGSRPTNRSRDLHDSDDRAERSRGQGRTHSDAGWVGA